MCILLGWEDVCVCACVCVCVCRESMHVGTRVWFLGEKGEKGWGESDS